MLTELLCNLFRRSETPAESLGDLSAAVTGIILALSLPPKFPLWAAVVGSVFAIAIGKMVFGGLGSNIFNPAMAGRTFLTACFGMLMTSWIVPATIDQKMPAISPDSAIVDVRTQATPLAWSKQALKKENPPGVVEEQIRFALWGETGGCLGETSAIAILLGGLYLLIRKTITFHIPLAVIGSAMLFAAIAWVFAGDVCVSPMIHLTTGGLLFCAFFIATDPVTAPLPVKGMYIFGVGVGFLIMLIRIVGEYPEGVMYAVLLMNAVTPLIDRLCKITPAGGKPDVKS
jgi:electron transport complex protein RnfD